MVNVKLGAKVSDFGHNLDRSRSGSDDCDALALQVDVGVPFASVHVSALEALESRVLGPVWVGERSTGVHNDVAAEDAGAEDFASVVGATLPVTRLFTLRNILENFVVDFPAVVSGVPASVIDGGVEGDVLVETVLERQALL